VFGEAAAGSDGGAASAGEIVTIGAEDAFDDAEMAQTGEFSDRVAGEDWPRSGSRSVRRRPAILKPGRWTLRGSVAPHRNPRNHPELQSSATPPRQTP
jgi:hypothetical protein